MNSNIWIYGEVCISVAHIWRSITLSWYRGFPELYLNTSKILVFSMIVLIFRHLMPKLTVNSVVSAFKIYPESDHFLIRFTATIISHINYPNSLINGFYRHPVPLQSVFSRQSDPLKHIRLWHSSLQNLLIASKHKYYYGKSQNPCQRFPCPPWSKSLYTSLDLAPSTLPSLHPSVQPNSSLCCGSDIPVKPLPQGLCTGYSILDALP